MDYYPLLLGTTLTKVGSKDEAEDICQEVFIIFYEKFNQIDNHRRWLLGTLRNVILRYYQNKNRDTSDIEAAMDDVKLTFVNGFRDTRILISEAMDAIDCDDEERLILDLVAVHNFSYNNTAKSIGLSRRQVEYKYGQLVKKISDYLTKKGINDIEELL